MPVIYHRFSDGVEVVRCVLEFCKVAKPVVTSSVQLVSISSILSPARQEVAEVERSYSSSIHGLVRSSAYTFHSNILMQWLGSEPYEEIGWAPQSHTHHVLSLVPRPLSKEIWERDYHVLWRLLYWVKMLIHILLFQHTETLLAKTWHGIVQASRLACRKGVSHLAVLPYLPSHPIPPPSHFSSFPPPSHSLAPPPSSYSPLPSDSLPLPSNPLPPLPTSSISLLQSSFPFSPPRLMLTWTQYENPCLSFYLSLRKPERQ